MVSKAQLRILAWLSKYPQSVENDWDVTREISLPGIAEGLGVVRSALNLPLTKLEDSGLISKRTAHVIGGGGRRRQVYHITFDGRSELDQTSHDFSKSKVRDQFIGNPPIIEAIFGRKDEQQECLSLLEENSLMLSGMPGIGKSSFALSLGQAIAKQRVVRWAVADQFSDYLSIITTWFPNQSLPRDIDSFCTVMNDCQDFLVIDDFNHINRRHIDSVLELVEKLANIAEIRLLLISRDSSNILQGFSKFKLEALDAASCCTMLGESMDLGHRQTIAESLGHHPLALKLYQPEYNIPESSSDIIAYVENVVLNSLSEAQKAEVCHLSLEPVAMDSSDSIIATDVDFYDEQNLLRWDGDSLFELQHLIRNVVRNNLTSSEKQEAHHRLAQHWQEVESAGAEENYLFHLARSNLSDFISELSDRIVSLDGQNTAAIAAMISDSIDRDNPQPDLVYLSSKVAAYRFEPAIIRKNLAHLNGQELLEMQFTLAQIEGRNADCESMLSDVLKNKSPLQQAKLLVLLASQTLEDRLPSQVIDVKTKQSVEQYLSMINLKKIDHGRQSIIVAISIIKHSIMLAENNFLAAKEIVQSLNNIGSIDDSIINHLEAKALLAEFISGHNKADDISKLIDTYCGKITNQLMSESLKLRYLEVLVESDFELAKNRFSQLASPDNFDRSNTAIRYSARWWLLHSKIYVASGKSSLREALMRFREAGCSNVVTELEQLLHAQI